MEDIKERGRNLSAPELHALAFFFMTRYLEQTPPAGSGVCAKVRAAKQEAAAVFQKPADEWEGLLVQHARRNAGESAWGRCHCKCGCKAPYGGCTVCGGCHRVCCPQCHPANPGNRGQAELLPYFEEGLGGTLAPRCHDCVRQPRFLAAKTSPLGEDGLRWYFNFPWEEPVVTRALYFNPHRWCDPNRDPRFDPKLVEVTEVWKQAALQNPTRHARPPAWENAFDVDVVLADARGGTCKASINLFAFLMNPAWRSDPVVKDIEGWLLEDPRNLGYIGPVLGACDVPLRPPSPPSPPSPYAPGESTVTIEEIIDSEDPRRVNLEAARADYMRLTAGREVDDSGVDAEIREAARAAAKRRRTDDGLGLAARWGAGAD